MSMSVSVIRVNMLLMSFMSVTFGLSIMVLFMVALNVTLTPNDTGLSESVSASVPGRSCCVALTNVETYGMSVIHTRRVTFTIIVSVVGTVVFSVYSLNSRVVSSGNAIMSVSTLKWVLN